MQSAGKPRNGLLLGLLAAALALAGTGAAGPAAAEGELRLLVIRVTWGPAPLDETLLRPELAEAAAFYRRVSYGRLGLVAEITPLVTGYVVPRECFGDGGGEGGLGPVAARARAGAAALGYDLAAYDRFVYVFPAFVCGFGGLGSGPDVLLGGVFGWRDIVHELGHTFRLPHASSADCATCRVMEYGDPVSVMGGGVLDFGAWEKHQLGWLERVERARNVGTFTVGAVDEPGNGPQALTLGLPTGELWLEHRMQPEPQVIARLVRRPVRGAALRPVLLARGRDALVIPGLLRGRRVPAGGNLARLELTWLDRQAPGRPRLTNTIVGPTPDAVSLYWGTAAELGSGVAAYRVAVDGRVVATVTQRTAIVDGLRPGRHVVGVRAMDRAGNVGPAATAVVRLRARR